MKAKKNREWYLPIDLFSNGTPYRLSSKIAFPSKEARADWLKRNKDNPDRVTLKPKGDGWELTIAP